MKLIVRFSLVIVAVAAMAAISCSAAVAGTIGPGDNGQDSDNNDDARLLFISSSNPEALTAGTYSVTGWEYIFEATGTLNITGGKVTPLIVSGDASTDTYTYVAVGDELTAASNDFVSTFGSPVSFGTNNTFTLAADATIYAGFLAASDARAPIGFQTIAGGPDLGLIRFLDGVEAPVVGASPAGGNSNGSAFNRHYDLQINVEPVPVPEPATLVMGVLGLIGAGVTRRRTAS